MMQPFASVYDTKVFFILLVLGMEHLPLEFVKLKLLLLLLQIPAAFLAAHSVKPPQVLQVPSNGKKRQRLIESCLKRVFKRYFFAKEY